LSKRNVHLQSKTTGVLSGEVIATWNCSPEAATKTLAVSVSGWKGSSWNVPAESSGASQGRHECLVRDLIQSIRRFRGKAVCVQSGFLGSLQYGIAVHFTPLFFQKPFQARTLFEAPEKFAMLKPDRVCP
jgi:hypothetical protein